MINGIDQSYLQAELSDFCNEKLVGTSLSASLFPGDSFFLADVGTSHSSFSLSEMAQNIITQATTTISLADHVSSFSSCFLSIAMSNAEWFMDPDRLIPSIIAAGSMAVTVALAEKPADVVAQPVKMVVQEPETSVRMDILNPQVEQAGDLPVEKELYIPSHALAAVSASMEAYQMVGAASGVIAAAVAAAPSMDQVFSVVAADAGSYKSTNDNGSHTATLEYQSQILAANTTLQVSTSSSASMVAACPQVAVATLAEEPKARPTSTRKLAHAFDISQFIHNSIVVKFVKFVLYRLKLVQQQIQSLLQACRSRATTQGLFQCPKVVSQQRQQQGSTGFPIIATIRCSSMSNATSRRASKMFRLLYQFWERPRFNKML